MDHVVHINSKDESVKTVVLHLLPGEETIFNLVVINDGDPSDLSLLASDPLFKAVRFRRSDDHVDTKQTIPIFARMPIGKDRLDGEIILTSSNGESRVPILILRDTDSPGSDSIPALEAELQGRSSRPRKIPSRAIIRDIAPTDDEKREEYEEEGMALNRKGDIDPDIEDEDGEEEEETDQAHGPYGRQEDEDESSIPVRDGSNENDEVEKGHIVFSRDLDLEKYRSSRRPRRVEDLCGQNDENRSQDQIKGRSDRGHIRRAPEYDEDPIDHSAWQSADSPDNCSNDLNSVRANHRIDDRFTSRAAAEDIDNLSSPGGESYIDRSNIESNHFDFDRESQAFQKEGSVGIQAEDGFYPPEAGRGASFGLGRGGPDEVPIENIDSDQLQPDEEAEYPEEDDSGVFGAMQIIPAAIFLSLVAVLVLTFITETIPEFPGALVSSILIVTLIIYGAATLLKA